MKRWWLTTTLVAVLAAGSACSQDTAGTPLPGNTGTTTETTSEPPESTSKPVESGSALADVKPCDLLPSAATSSLGITKELGEDEVGDARICEWRIDKESLADSYTLTVAIFESLGLDDVVADGEVEKMKIGSHDAAQSLRGSGGGCAVSLAVTASSRVDVQGAGRDGRALCPSVLAAAELVEPELP